MVVLEREKRLLRLGKCSRYSLLCYVLQVCRKPKSMAEIYWKRPNAFTYRLLKSLTVIAVEHKLIEKKNGKFLTTEKGKEFIEKFNGLLELLEK